MRVMLPADRLDYLKKEMKARVMLKNMLLKSKVYESEYDERIAELDEEILDICDEIADVDEALWSGREIYK